MSDEQGWRTAMAQAATEAVMELNWNVFPLSVSSKKPLTGWKEYQDRPVDIEEVGEWFRDGAPAKNLDGSTRREATFNLALATGYLSGVIVLDCDNEAALDWAKENGLTSPISVKTTRGQHFYFAHPGHGQRFMNKVGGTSTGWPGIHGLDLRADGGYVILPPSVKIDEDGAVAHLYDWQIEEGASRFSLPPWPGVPTTAPAASTGGFHYEDLSLADARVAKLDDGAPILEQIEMKVARLGRRLQDGDGRTNLLAMLIGQHVRRGFTRDEVVDVALKAQDDFYAEPLDRKKVEAMADSLIRTDRRNYPNDYEDDGSRKRPQRVEITPAGAGVTIPEGKTFRPIYPGDAETLLSRIGERRPWIDPIIAPGEITQIVGFSGHGKSLVTSALLTSLAAGRESFGPYHMPGPARVLYLDYDNPARTILSRLRLWRSMFGETADRFALWTPTLIPSHEGGALLLSTDAGFAELGEWCDAVKPDVVVIDTIRNAFPGMEENKSDEWAKVNHVAKTIRNEIGAAVVLVHHRNKPGADGLGREAGSTAQLTDLDTQVYVTQVYREKNVAKAKAGLYNEDCAIVDHNGDMRNPYPYLEERMPANHRLLQVTQMMPGKTRQESELTETHYIGWCESLVTGQRMVVSTLSKKQKALILASSQGMNPTQIASHIMVPTNEVRKWLTTTGT